MTVYREADLQALLDEMRAERDVLRNQVATLKAAKPKRKIPWMSVLIAVGIAAGVSLLATLIATFGSSYNDRVSYTATTENNVTTVDAYCAQQDKCEQTLREQCGAAGWVTTKSSRNDGDMWPFRVIARCKEVRP